MSMIFQFFQRQI